MPMIATHGLTKRYGSIVALDDLDLELEEGIVGLVGANGAGKSTLIKILLGLVEATAGTAELLGRPIAGHGLEARRLLGYMPEHDCLPTDVSATEFVAHMARIAGMPRAAARERTAETLRHVGLFEERYREIRGYSTGMRQRVKLAQALVHDPRLLLLDEPTNGLDPEGRDQMLDLVRRIGTEFGISILMSSHLLSEIERVCDHLVVIDGGRVLRSAAIASFTQRTGTLSIELDAPAAPLAGLLRAAGYRCRDDRHLLAIDADDESVYDAVRDGAVALDVGLVRLTQQRERLEDIFRAGGSDDA